MKYKKIHFVGIKGVGMTALALMCKETGAQVTGSDVDAEFITDKPLNRSGISVSKNFNSRNIVGADLIIYSGSHNGKENIEVVAALEKGIKVMTLSEALSHTMDGELFGDTKKGIVITGTHGKTTTTGLITTILSENNEDPSYFIGTSEVSSLKNPGHFGKGKYVVIEGDEYVNDPKHDRTAKFLQFKPEIAVITNIDYDHVDIYDSLDDVRETFAKLIKNINDTGVLIAYGDDPEVRKIIKNTSKKVITYGFSQHNNYFIKRVTVSSSYTFFHVEGAGADFGEFAIQIMGEHNALNALGAAIVGLEVGLPVEDIKSALKKYAGAKRRFEKKGQLPSGALVYDDYAHHPTEIKKTLQTFKQLFPRKKLISIFQPHTYSRTKKLFEDFLRSFTDADEVIITDVYGSKREEVDPTVSAEAFVQQLSLSHKNARVKKSLSDVVEYVQNKRYNEDFVIVTIGAGDVYLIAERLVKENDVR
jgi:UDP-N-acetylmuramate--alanine ligase